MLGLGGRYPLTAEFLPANVRQERWSIRPATKLPIFFTAVGGDTTIR